MSYSKISERSGLILHAPVTSDRCQDGNGLAGTNPTKSPGSVCETHVTKRISIEAPLTDGRMQ